jgi:enoyl-CoA hydratase/carnithine racemase
MSTVRVDVRPDAVAVLTFDQPDSRANVLTAQMWADFEAALDPLADRIDIAGLVLASAKPGIFIAGADLKLLADAPAPNDPAVRAFIDHGLRVLEKLEALLFPTCAAIDGAALGGGLEVALACDSRVVGTNPKVALGLPEVKLGLIPGWGGTQRLPRVLRVDPLTTATDMLLTGNPLTAAEAEHVGLAEAGGDDVVAAAVKRVRADAQWVGQRLRKKHALPPPADFNPRTAFSPATVEGIRVLTAGVQLPLAAAIKLETAAFMTLAGSAESKRLIAEFFASRKKPA